jgi:hypothetical protein
MSGNCRPLTWPTHNVRGIQQKGAMNDLSPNSFVGSFLRMAAHCVNVGFGKILNVFYETMVCDSNNAQALVASSPNVVIWHPLALCPHCDPHNSQHFGMHLLPSKTLIEMHLILGPDLRMMASRQLCSGPLLSLAIGWVPN